MIIIIKVKIMIPWTWRNLTRLQSSLQLISSTPILLEKEKYILNNYDWLKCLCTLHVIVYCICCLFTYIRYQSLQIYNLQPMTHPKRHGKHTVITRKLWNIKTTLKQYLMYLMCCYKANSICNSLLNHLYLMLLQSKWF